jgi:16S rRNA (uracil1498-N3)-methyltransferase
VKHRLYVAPPIQSGQTLDLDSERAHYLLRVLRLRRGQEIECFDGIGRAWVATLADASARSAKLQVGALLAEAPEPEPRLHLAQGLLKGAAMDRVVQKATELGATDLWPILAERSNVPADPARQQRKRLHWQRVIENAAEQCGTLHLPRLHHDRDLARFLAEAPAARTILLDPGAACLPLTLPRVATCVLVGPEGGWSEAERGAAMNADVRSHGLGDRVLRAETAPLAVLAALRHGWGWR